MPTQARLAQMSCFRRSVLCRDMTQALHNSLARFRDDLAPPHDSPAHRYHIVNVTASKPILGWTMDFEDCSENQEFSIGCCPYNMMCFDPNYSAVRYMARFLSNERVFREVSRPEVQGCPLQQILALYRDCIPGQHVEGFSNAITNIFLDLYYALDRWDPAVHGIVAWTGDSFEALAVDYMTQIMAARARKGMRDFRGHVESDTDSE